MALEAPRVDSHLARFQIVLDARSQTLQYPGDGVNISQIGDIREVCFAMFHQERCHDNRQGRVLGAGDLQASRKLPAAFDYEFIHCAFLFRFIERNS
jgi:hypothetical protein